MSGVDRRIADRAGIQRVVQEGGGFWGYLPNDPDVDINTYHKQVDFNSARDIDTNKVWRESSRVGGTPGYPLKLLPWTGPEDGHADAMSSSDVDSYYQYQDRYFNGTLGRSMEGVWFQCEVKVEADPGADSVSFFGLAAYGDEVPDLLDSRYAGLFVYTQGGDTFLAFGTRGEDGVPGLSDEYLLEHGEMNMVAFRIHRFYADTNIAIVDIYANDMSEPIETLKLEDTPIFSYLPSALVHPTFFVSSLESEGRGRMFLNYLKTIIHK